MSKKVLILIVGLSLLIRLYKPSSQPLLWDEASLGYNAYSILQTGRDEYGSLLPLIFKSFGDYKPGLYVYLALPFVAIFGLNPLAVRLPSILLGSLLPLFLFLLIKQLSPKSEKLALIAAAVLAFNPYNIHFSRGAWETNILTIELVLATYFFFKSRLTLSALLFAATLYTYQSGKLISLLLIFALFLIDRKKIFTKKFILPLALLALPIAYGLIFSQSSNRLKVVSLFSYPRSSAETQTIISESSQLNYSLFHNRLVFFTRNFLSRYFNHFSPQFLTFVGDWQNARHSAPYLGLLLYPSLIFLGLGLFKADYSQRLARFFLFWLLLAPIPAALTRDSVQATRAMSLSIPLVFFISQGLAQIKSITLARLTFLAYLFSFVYYFDLYHHHLIKKTPKQLLFGYQEAISYLIDHQSLSKNLFFTDFYGQPYIFYLFFSKYPPKRYQGQAQLTISSLDTGRVESIDSINFFAPNLNGLPENSLVIYSHDEILRQNIDLDLLTPLAPVNNYSTFYAYQK